MQSSDESTTVIAEAKSDKLIIEQTELDYDANKHSLSTAELFGNKIEFVKVGENK